MKGQALTWMIGGVSLIICGVLSLVQFTFPGFALQAVASLTRTVLFAATMVILSIGLSRDSSVVGRRPAGVIAMVVLGIWPIAQMTLYQNLANTPREGDTALMILGIATLVVPTVAAITAAIQVVLAKTVPPPWHRAPLWVVGVAIVLYFGPQVLVYAVGVASTQALAGLVIGSATLAYLIVTAGLGAIAVALALRAHSPTSPRHSPTAL
ncbi:MAG TPA: hypothetical protein PK781_05365 [Terrimesophilobacter sp.]|nr:hypothetical protein [Terrimesophilobacter sp.]HRP99872.1 hypothetical protein [Terrimesophilobacter sp.]